MIYILLTFLLLISATSFFINFFKKTSVPSLYIHRDNLNLPPVVKGWPLVGALYMLIKDPVDLMKKNYQKHGSVFTMKVLGQSITILIGPEVLGHFYTALDSELSQDKLLRFTVPMFGPNVAYGISTEKRRQKFQFLTKGLRPQILRYYVGQILQETQEYLSKWQECGTVDFVHELQHLITLTITRCLLGNDVRGNVSEDVSSLIRDLSNGLLPISFIFPYLPIPAHKRRDRARRKLYHIFSTIINSRKASLRSEEDLLQTLLESTYMDGESNTDEQVAGISIAILFAGQHNTGNASVWIGAYLLQNKTYLLKTLEEQMVLLRRHGSKIDFDIVGEMDVLYRCIREAIRIGSPPVITPRYCYKTFNVTTKEGKEYTIPKGHIVATSPAMANRIDYVHRDPDRYDPDRYLSIREGTAKEPLSDITFGGGRHPCPGEMFTYVMLKTIWSYLLRNFELDLISTLPEGKWNGKEKILVYYKRRQLSV